MKMKLRAELIFMWKVLHSRLLLKQRHENSEIAYYGRERLHASQVAHKAEAFLVLVAWSN